MELKYIKTGDYELPNLTLNNNKKYFSDLIYK